MEKLLPLIKDDFINLFLFLAMQDMAEYALDVSKADYTEIRIEKVFEQGIAFVNGEFKGIESNERKGFLIRIIKDATMGFYFSNDFRKAKIKEGIEKAIKMAHARKKHKIHLSEEKMEEAKDIIKGKEESIDKKIDYLKNIDKIASDYSRSIFYNDELMEKYYANSEGARIYSKIPRISLHYLITVSNGKVEQMNREFGNSGGWENISKWNAREYIEHDINFLKKLIKEGKKAPRKGDVILSPYITGLIAHESCGHPFEADRIMGREAAQAGKSFVMPSFIGKKYANENVSIVDDPTIEKSYGYYKYDDEGVKARKRYLVKNGIVNEFLHNRETAYEMGVKSNSAARASYGKEPIVRMANTYFMPGSYTLEEMIEDIKEGVYMKTYVEWNIDDRRYNQKYVGEEAYIIKNGEISGIAYHPIIEMTTPKLYNSIDAVGKELKFYPATCGKGDPMQGVPVTTGGVDLRLRGVKIK